MKQPLLFAALLGFCLQAFAQKLNLEEQKLYNLMMVYRKSLGLQDIPISPNLNKVAQMHARDLAENYRFGTECNMHSWSSKGRWKAVCYTADHAQKELMWSKPAELSAYKAFGFEIAHGGPEGYVATAEKALEGWKGSPGHNALIAGKAPWDKTQWKAIGIGIYKGFAIVWFGMEADNPVQ